MLKGGKRNKNLKWLFFDLGNVIYRLNFKAVWDRMCFITGKSVEDIKRALYNEDLFNGFEKGFLSPEKYHSGVCDILKTDIPYDEFVEAWNMIIERDNRIFNFVRSLKSSFRILIISNTNYLNYSIIEDEITEIADELVLSFKVGVMKPDYEIFRIAVSKAGVNFEDVLFIDDMEENIRAASELGINVYHYRDSNGFFDYIKTLLS